MQLSYRTQVHVLNESRGSTLEVIVSRMKARGSGIRFILISATVPNVEDVACWIGSNDGSDRPAGIFQVDLSSHIPSLLTNLCSSAKNSGPASLPNSFMVWPSPRARMILHMPASLTYVYSQ